MVKAIDPKTMDLNDGLDDLFHFVSHNDADSEKIVAPRYSYWKSVGRVFFKKRSNWVVLGLLFVLLFMSFIYPLFVTYGLDAHSNPNLIDPKTYNLSPSAAFSYFMGVKGKGFSLSYLFGTTSTGNYVFDGLWYGTRTSFSLALICTLINMTIGVLLGAVWGLSKSFDAVMMQIYNIIANVPYVLLVSVLVYVIGAGFTSFIFALCVTGWLSIAYFIRTQVIIIRDREYNLASKCLGTGVFKVVVKNILPFMVSVIVTVIASELPSYISYEVFLSYIGLGLSASTPSIGRMISESEASWTAFPWQFWPPVLAAGVISIVLYVVGQNIGDASDPRTHM